MKKQITIIIFILVILVVASGCAGKNQKDARSEIADNQSQGQAHEQLNQVATSSGVVDTSGWKTYKNEEYGFELMHPNEITKEGKLQIENIIYGYEIVFNNVYLSVINFDGAQQLDTVMDQPYFPFFFVESPYDLKKPSERWKYGQEIYKSEKQIINNYSGYPTSCRKEEGDILCYSYNQPSDEFSRYDIIYFGNYRYEFRISLAEGLDWSNIPDAINSEIRNKEIERNVSQRIDKYFQGRFNEQDQTKIHILKKIRENLSFF